MRFFAVDPLTLVITSSVVLLEGASLPFLVGDALKGLSHTAFLFESHRVAQTMVRMLRRACRLSSKLATAAKRHEIARLLEAYRGGVNFYVGSLWQDPGALDQKTLARLASENRVLPVAVDPRGTSRTCPVCGEDDRRNRNGEVFRCIACDHKGDADFIGARNVLTKTLAALGRVLSPGQKMSVHQQDVFGQTVRGRSAPRPACRRR